MRVFIVLVLIFFSLSSEVLAGGEPYWYYVEYDTDINSVLQQLRFREFKAGRYNPVIPHLDFPITDNSPKPGAKHETSKDVLREAGAEGTRSILDIEKVANQSNYSVAAPFSNATLKELFGTIKPTREIVEKDGMSFLDKVERGHCVYIILYKNDIPHEILFAGYSFD